MSSQTSLPNMLDRHLDLLLSMALEQMEQEADARFSQSPDPEVQPADALQMDRAFASACETARRQQRGQRRTRRAKKVASFLRLAGGAAAALMFLLLLAFPVALGASAEFRAYVTQMLVRIDEARNAVSIVFQPEEASPLSPVSDRWQGLYFPRDIPKGFSLSAYDEQRGQAVFTSPAGQRITFSESLGPMPEPDIPEGAFFMLEFLHGGDFPVIEERGDGLHRVTVTWEAEGRWFRLVTENMDREEALRIAEGTDTLSDISGSYVEAAISTPALAGSAVPSWWQGSYYPAALPESIQMTAFNILEGRVELYEQNGKRIIFTEDEASEPGAVAIAFGDSADFRSVTVNGIEGFLAAAGTGENADAYLFWQIGNVRLKLETRGMTAEETLALAESVKKLESAREEQSAGIMLLRDAAGSTLPPKEWSGACFPAYVPEGFFVNAMAASGASRSLTLLQPETKATVTLRESSFYPSPLPDLNALTNARLFPIGSGQGLLLQGEEPAGAVLCLYWQTEEGPWMELQASQLPEETALRIAQSVRPIGTLP